MNQPLISNDPRFKKALDIVRMIQREIPRTMGTFNLHLLMEDISEVERGLTSLLLVQPKEAHEGSPN